MSYSSSVTVHVLSPPSNAGQCEQK